MFFHLQNDYYCIQSIDECENKLMQVEDQDILLPPCDTRLWISENATISITAFYGFYRRERQYNMMLL